MLTNTLSLSLNGECHPMQQGCCWNKCIRIGSCGNKAGGDWQQCLTKKERKKAESSIFQNERPSAIRHKAAARSSRFDAAGSVLLQMVLHFMWDVPHYVRIWKTPLCPVKNCSNQLFFYSSDKAKQVSVIIWGSLTFIHEIWRCIVQHLSRCAIWQTLEGFSWWKE